MTVRFVEIDRTWMTQAECLGDFSDDRMFPHRGESLTPARELCDKCPVRVECLQYALANREKHGVWGGMSERQRRALRRPRAVERTRFAAERIREAGAMRKHGFRVSEIAAHFGVSRRQAARYVSGSTGGVS